MKIICLTATLAIALGAAPALADKGGKSPKHHTSQQFMDCPPGLAKKHNGCLPPGQAKKRHHAQRYGVGDYLPDGEYRLIDRPWRYGLPRDGVYAVIDGNTYRINRRTAEILAVYGALKALAD